MNPRARFGHQNRIWFLFLKWHCLQPQIIAQGDMMKKVEPTQLRLLTVNELAEILNVSARTVFRLKDAGKLPPPIQIGTRLLRWRLDVIDKWLGQNCLMQV